jgi:hypothetical protein
MTTREALAQTGRCCINSRPRGTGAHQGTNPPCYRKLQANKVQVGGSFLKLAVIKTACPDLHAGSSRDGRREPEVAHEQMAGLNFMHGVAQAWEAGKLFHIDLNDQMPGRYDQDFRFGLANPKADFWLVKFLEDVGYKGRVTSTRTPTALKTMKELRISRAAACA